MATWLLVAAAIGSIAPFAPWGMPLADLLALAELGCSCCSAGRLPGALSVCLDGIQRF